MRAAAKYLWIVLGVAFVGGYLLLDTSGLLGRQAVTSGTSIGSVNGKTITYGEWLNRVTALSQQYEQQTGRGLDGDQRAQIENQAFEELVSSILLDQEYTRRNIHVSAQDIRDAAHQYPPQEVMQNPDLQTDGHFDPVKWERFLASPTVRQQGILIQLQHYYEDAIPRNRFYQELASDVYTSDTHLWRMYEDAHDSASVSFVAFRPTAAGDSAAKPKVTDAEIAAYFETYKKKLVTPARAVVSVLTISRVPTAADTEATRQRLVAVRKRITGGEKFEAVAKEVSDDSATAKDGGKLAPAVKGQFRSKLFEDALFKLKVGEMSEPVRSEMGWHLIRLDAKKGDTVTARQILLAVKVGDSTDAAAAKVADRLAKIAANSEDGRKLDSAAKDTKITPLVLDVVEGQRAMTMTGAPLAGLAQWATGGTAKVGDVSELFDTDDAYFVARLDSLVPGGTATLDKVKDQMRMYLAHKKAIEARSADAAAFAKSAVSSSFESAAKAANLTVQTTKMFTRTQFVPGLGQGSPAIGAAFGIGSGAVSEPIVTDDGVYVIRVDKRINADRAAWQAQVAAQRAQVDQQMQQDRVRQYLGAIREDANVVDKRKAVFAAGRRQ